MAYTNYNEWEATGYHKLLPPAGRNTWYYTRMKAGISFGRLAGVSRREEIVLVTLEDSNGERGFRKAFILAEQWADFSLTRSRPLEVFDDATWKQDYPRPPCIVHGWDGFPPNTGSFTLAHLSSSPLPEVVVKLLFTGGSYGPLFVAVVSQRNGQLELALRARGGATVDMDLEVRDLDGDGRCELLLPDQIPVSGLDHASCPSWISCYQWNGSRLALAPKLFYFTDLRIEDNLRERYNRVLRLDPQPRRYYEEYEYYLGLAQLYKGRLPQASYFLRRVSERAEDRDYSLAASSLLRGVEEGRSRH